MPDSPDYQKYLAGSVRFSLQDMGELAARLKSPAVYDRRGELFWYDQCEHGLSSWFAQTGGAGAENAVIANNSFLGAYAYRMTGGSTLTRLARLTKQLALFDISTIGFECAWFHDANVETFDMKIQYAYGGFQYSAIIRHDIVNGKVQYLDSSNSYVDLASISFPIISGSPYRFSKFVINTVTQKYIRILEGINHYNDLDFSFYNVGAFSTEYFQVVFEVVSNSGSNGIVHIGQTIITANEP